MWMIPVFILGLHMIGNGNAGPEFTEDSYATDEKFREKVSSKEIIGVIGGKAELPCDLTPPFPSDFPHLILFYKDVFGTPIYSYDMRSHEKGRHWIDNQILGSRAFFHYHETGEVSETGAKVIASGLVINPLTITDKGNFRCRVDFQKAPTRNTKIKLHLITLPGNPRIFTASGIPLGNEITDPLREDSTLILVCETIGGDPLPRLSWLTADNVVIDDVVEEINTKTLGVKNILRMSNLKRSHHETFIFCRASNTNLTKATTTSIKINLVFPPVKAKILREWSFFRVGQAYNVSCQVFGSKPPASTIIYVGSSQLREVQYKISPDGNVSTTTVVFIPTQNDQDAFLTCRAENLQVPLISIEDKWKIKVHYVPIVNISYTEEYKKHLRVGDTVHLECHVTSNPLPDTIEWIFQNKPLKIIQSQVGQKYKDILVLHSIQLDQTGNYSCQAENQLGRSVSSTLKLNLEPFSNCSFEKKLIHVDLHSDVVLVCNLTQLDSHTDYNFVWNLNTTNRKIINLNKDSSSVKNKVQNTLVYRPLSMNDYGSVTCSTENSFPCIFVLLPSDTKTNSIQNCSISNQTVESFTVKCIMTAVLGKPFSNFTIEVYDSTNKYLISKQSSEKSPNFHVKGLSPGTEYLIELYTESLTGRSSKVIFDAFTLQSVEKQLAATITDLQPSQKSALGLLPLLGTLLAIASLLLLLSILFTILIKNKTRRERAENSNNRIYNNVDNSKNTSSSTELQIPTNERNFDSKENLMQYSNNQNYMEYNYVDISTPKTSSKMMHVEKNDFVCCPQDVSKHQFVFHKHSCPLKDSHNSTSSYLTLPHSKMNQDFSTSQRTSSTLKRVVFKDEISESNANETQISKSRHKKEFMEIENESTNDNFVKEFSILPKRPLKVIPPKLPVLDDTHLTVL